MAATASKTPLLRLLNKRSLATAAKPMANTNANIRVTNLPNKLVVASADSPIPGIVKVSVAFRSGSRYEKEDTLGASHVLRASCGLSTVPHTQFSITRNLQQMGAGLSCTSCREAVVYTLETTESHLDDALHFLSAVSTCQTFKPWELKDNQERIRHELHHVPPQAVALDMFHNAAYRDTLGNSIFVREHRIKALGSETMQHFVNNNFKSNRAAVTGVGISHDRLAEFAQQLSLSDSGSSGDETARYRGGEVRKETGGQDVWVVLGGEACSLQKKEVFAWGVLAKALGGSPRVKYSTGSSPLSKMAASIPSCNATAVHIPHSDSGLLAIAVNAHSSYATQAMEGVMKVLKGEGLSDADIARGKACLQEEVLSSGDGMDPLLAELTYQSLLVGSVSSPSQIAASIDQVTTSQVQEVLNKFRSGKKSMAAIGNIHSTPYLDDLK